MRFLPPMLVAFAGCGHPATGAAIVTTPCVLHAGSSHAEHTPDGGAQGVTCSVNAECVAVPGKPARGDGFVDVDCDGSACACTWQSAVTPPATRRDPFTHDHLPTEPDACKRVLIDRCLAGMKVVP